MSGWYFEGVRRVSGGCDGHPPKGSILQTRNLALTLNSQDQDQVKTARNGYQSSLGWSPQTQEWSHQKEVYYRLGIRHFDIIHKTKTM